MEGESSQTNFHMELVKEQAFYEKALKNADEDLQEKLKRQDVLWDTWIYEVNDCSPSYSNLVEELSSEVYAENIPLEQLTYIGDEVDDHVSLVTLVATLDLSKPNGVATLATLAEALDVSVSNPSGE